MKRRRVVIETSCLSVKPDRLVRTGIQEVQHRLLLELPRLRTARHDLELLAAPLPAPSPQASPGILGLIEGLTGASTESLWGHPLPGGELTVEEVIDLWASADVVHLQSFVVDPAPLLSAVARRTRRIQVSATIYDTIPLMFPEYFTRAMNEQYSAFARCVRRHANLLVGISRHTALDALELLGGSGPGAPRVGFVTLPDAPLLAEGVGPSGALLERLGLRPGQYVVALGSVEPRKGLDRLLSGFERHVERAGRPLQLVLVAGGGWKDRSIRERLASSPARGWIVETGYLEEPELAELIQNARTLAMLSMYEGFGLPVAQARAAGLTPLIAAGSSLPEAAPNGCVQVDPWDPDSVAVGLELVAAAGKAGRPVPGRGWSAWADELLEVIAPRAAGAR